MLLDSNTFDKLLRSLLSCGVFSKGKSIHLLDQYIYLGGLFPFGNFYFIALASCKQIICVQSEHNSHLT